MLVTTGSPFVSVPVLSKRIVSMRPALSSAAASLIKMPRKLASPVPTMTAMGPANPSAHGHEMINTAVAAAIPVGHEPAMPHPMAVTAAITSTIGTNTDATRSAMR